MVLRGRYEIVYLAAPLVALAFIFANHFNIVGMGRDFAKNLGVHYNLVLFMGLTIAAMITAFAIGAASLVFQTINNNTIVTPCLLGMNSLYTLIHTLVFFFNVTGNDGRCSIIGREIGFENLAGDQVTSTHGNESSFELVVQMDPDYIFVMDRDAAISSDGAQLAQEIMEHELVMSTRCYQDGHLVILEHPEVWYTGEGGITALDYMLKDLESALL